MLEQDDLPNLFIDNQSNFTAEQDTSGALVTKDARKYQSKN